MEIRKGFLTNAGVTFWNGLPIGDLGAKTQLVTSMQTECCDVVFYSNKGLHNLDVPSSSVFYVSTISKNVLNTTSTLSSHLGGMAQARHSYCTFKADVFVPYIKDTLISPPLQIHVQCWSDSSEDLSWPENEIFVL